MCDWANGRPTDTCAISTNSLHKRLDEAKVEAITAPDLLPKPLLAVGNISTRVEFVAGDLTNSTYSTVVKVSTLWSPFSENWAIAFALPANQTVEWTSRGNFSVDNSTVTITSDPAAEKSKNMAAVFKFTGSFSGEYVLPDTSSAVFTSS
ncbi:hypothetical protein FBU59_005229 [Linderina macrospora]|uniref:Uncharacterized protein n=1 Tax=Linderina macrospora TaxID=4868 RepID=A0ACC1J365_9FUNG|nr:hypothetical protein FBU59_005229 [Linderina macrospora]